MHLELLPGFRKADINSIPTVRNDAIFAYIAKIAKKSTTPNVGMLKPKQDVDMRVDYVQVRKTGELHETHAMVFPAAAGGTSDANVGVKVTVDASKGEILESACEQCQKKAEACPHVLAYIFWLNRKSTDADASGLSDFWGGETESLREEEHAHVYRIRDLFVCDDIRADGDVESASLSDSEGQAFVDTVMNDMEEVGLTDSILYKHCRPVVNELEPLFVHHTLLNSLQNHVKDVQSFSQHMEEQSKAGLFDRLQDCTKDNYKSPLWLEAQYMRLRCSQIHYVVSRKDALDEERIWEMLLCKNRENNTEERQAAKKHKRYILKQTEKLEQKRYNECGLLLSEAYPYICAAPDGITDDHIVEIKAPKTEEDFEKYLEGRETIAPKYMAQLQIQMYMANVSRALYCVLSPTFDKNGALHYVWVMADMEFVASLLNAAEDFWKDVIFPRLAKIYLENK